MQQPKRFQAPTMAEAYDQVRRELGESAVILSTRKAFAPGLFGQPGRQFVEVVARVPQEAAAVRARRPALDQDEAAHDLVRALAEATATAPLTAQSGSRSTSEPAFSGFQQVASAEDLPPTSRQSRGSKRTTAGEAPPVTVPVPSAASDEPWSRQLDQMRTMLEQLVSERHNERIDGAPAAVRERIERHGVAPSLATSILGEIDAVATHDEQALVAAVERRLAAKFAPPATINLRRQRAVFLVGPGGG